MNLFHLILRLIHIVGGTLWVGFALFLSLMLTPALGELGPDAGKVMGALQRRGLTTLLPWLAVATMLSGFWLYWRVSGGTLGAYLASPQGLALAGGGVVAVLAYAVGMTVTRPATMQVTAAMQGLAAATPEERERIMATVARLRARGAVGSRWVTILLFLALGAMAVARYV